ncbi:putative multiheme cytochrome c [Thermincola ferriacetica]|uniref:Putative multiheme cytochrome c n=1 Tax=Thermincola ferriacetica TaxID=281456 RepID=A0A0L6W657_9FIRM|nr:inner-membrane decaheme cytochrome A [Thermincola ferriacetica]KNZ71000.1 putative multiheme cytochrome c [Thermincola ferriacetica]
MGIRDKFKFDLSKTEDKLKLFILVSGALLFILVAAVAGISLTMSPEFCVLCHDAMQPEYVTWKVSSHSNIRCVDCHMEPGVVNILIEKVMASKHLINYAITKEYKEEKPLHMKNELPSHLCEKCHNVKNRNFTLSGDLIVPHELHGEKGVGCVKCHSGVAHGNIYKRGVSVGDIGAWTLEDGKKNMAKQFTQPDMDVCVECHMNPAKFGVQGVKSVTFRCEACHKSIFTPENHKDKGWTSQGLHGVSAESGDKEFKGCVMCHSIGVKTEKIATGNKVKDFAWGNQFCSSCHAKLPPSHAQRDVWMPNHKKVVATKGMKNCEACHSLKAPEGKVSAPAGLYCNKCHWFK